MRCWVVGASGLLGQGVVRQARREGWDLTTSVVPWHDPDSAVQTLTRDVRAFLDADPGSPWAIAWCAGAGVVGTSREALEAELAVFTGFLDALAPAVVERDAAARGGMFVASSAGGVYAGASAPPFTEHTEPRPLAPYGEFKLLAEAQVAELVRRTGLPVMVGRISNLFGPGQDLTKAQGLVSQVGRSCLTRQPISMYVSLDTMRDYLFVDDCAQMVTGALERLVAAAPSFDGPVTKILAAGRSTTIAAVLGEYRRVFKRPPPVVLASSAASRFQVRDLRLRSVVWTELDGHARTPLGAGIAATVRDVSDRLNAPIV
ncbi:NAD-dependent epimerase/dehydratase family protein [Solicola sp. PLA-1-18]|uniref:NAD-dependent epimerase/dehydratase family protein n=1 Tax=Solicola sp. PLA-1-18 TaxID=3380532 RepID=UPI003B7E97BE